jgi:3'(2'), 5'-bisphosphate nucleotidase
VSDAGAQLSLALAAARAAARAIACVGDPRAFHKGDASPATVADLASQVAATRALQELAGGAVRIAAEEGMEEIEAHGGAGILEAVATAVTASGLPCTAAECETALRSARDEGREGCFWTVDPLDGTKGYLRGGQFAVAVALVMHGHPVIGVLALPRLGEHGVGEGSGVLVAAVRRHGAWQTPLMGGRATALRCAPWTRGGAVRVAGSVETSHSAVDALEAAAARVGRVESIRMDSQAKYALVARGSADAYIRSSPRAEYVERIWDHAAGVLVAEEAGCRATDCAGAPLDFGRGRGLEANRGVVCAVPELHAALLSALATPLG